MVRAFRQLSAIYVIAAGFYSFLMVVHARPELAQDLRALVTQAKQQGAEFADAAGSWVRSQTETPVTRAPERKVAEPLPPRAAPTQTAVVAAAKPVPMPVPPAPKIEAPRIAAPEAPMLRPKLVEPGPSFAEAPPKPETAEVKPPPLEAAPPPEEIMPGAAEVARVEERLHSNLTTELVAGFDLFLYVSKAEHGPWAQRMYVFDKQATGEMALLHAWPVSTGRNGWELNKAGWHEDTDTPSGYFQLDPNRFHVRYTSAQWGMPMPYAMFFNWVKDGTQTGLAIHGASGEDLALLGTRASAGCVRLAPENAKTLFNLVRAKYRGPVPRFAYDTKTSTMNNDGILWHDREGNPRLADGYRVLVFIENYGGDNVVAALY